jgi:hypothetical protein
MRRSRRYITGTKNAKQSVDYKTQKKKGEKKDTMMQITANISPSLWRAGCLIMGMAIIGSNASPPPHGNASLAVQRMEGASLRPQPQGEAAVAVQMMEGERKQTLTNDSRAIKNQARAARRTDERSIEETLVSIIPGVGGVFQLLNSPHLLGDPSRVATDGRSLGETLFAMIPGVGGFWQLFSSPHLYKPISTALRHLGKRDTSTIQPTRTPEEWTIQPTRTPERNTTQTEEWNRIHSGTCETHKDCADISFCSENHTCLPQGKFIMGCIAVVVIIGSGITACIWCPVPGRMGR